MSMGDRTGWGLFREGGQRGESCGRWPHLGVGAVNAKWHGLISFVKDDARECE